jgi:hypothetical protein
MGLDGRPVGHLAVLCCRPQLFSVDWHKAVMRSVYWEGLWALPSFSIPLFRLEGL